MRHKTGNTSDNKGVNVEDKDNASSSDVPDTTVTRRGRVVRKPLRFRVNHSSCPKGQLPNKGEDVKAGERDHAESCEQPAKKSGPRAEHLGLVL